MRFTELTGVVGDSFGDVEGGILAAHIVGALLPSAMTFRAGLAFAAMPASGFISTI
jgi:hypothetical protein